MQRKQILDRIVSIMKMVGKRGTSYRGTGSSEAVSALCDEKVNHGTFLETVLFLEKYDNILKCHLENVIKKCSQNKSDKASITVQTEICLSPKLLLTLSLLLYLRRNFKLG